LSFVRVANAQEATYQSDKELEKQADRLFEEEKFVEAYPIYSKLVIRAKKDIEFNYRLGVCAIYAVADKEQAIPFLELAITNPEVVKEAHYYLGKAYLLSYRFEDAIKQFNTYKETGSAKNIEKFQVDEQIKMCKNGTKLVRNITDWVVVDKKELNIKDFFLAYEISPEDGKLLIKPSEETFKTPIDIKKNEESIIFLAKDNKQIFFSSYGQDENHRKDIYRIVKLPNGTWSKPYVLPDIINTDKDEDYPFLHPNGKTLYFCSKGHNSMGGYDIFKTTYNEEKDTWSPPENLGFPINSPDDDILYVTDKSEKEAFFSSARRSPKGKVFVYKLDIEKKPVDWVLVKGRVKQKAGPQYPPVRITVKNLQDNSLVGVFNSNEKNGNYFLVLPNGGNCLFTIETPDFKTQSQTIAIPLRYENKPMKQELTYDAKTGKLMLKTTVDATDEELDEESLSMVKNKANLDISNNSGAKVQAKDIASEEVEGGEELDNALTDTRLNNDDIIRIAYEDAKELDNEAVELRKQADVALTLANQKNEIALKRLKESRALADEASQFTGDPAQKQILADKADEARKEAEQLRQEAAVAYNLAKKLDNAANRKRKEADLALQYAKALEAASKEKQSPESMAKVSEIAKQMEELDKNNTDTLSVFDSYKLSIETKQKELNKVLNSINEVKKEVTDNEALMAKSQTEADNTRNKSLKDGLLNEIEGLRQDNLDKQEEIKKYESKAKKLQDEYNTLVKESAMATDVANLAKNGSKEQASTSMTAANKTKPEQKATIADKATNKPADTAPLASAQTKKEVVKPTTVTNTATTTAPITQTKTEAAKAPTTNSVTPAVTIATTQTETAKTATTGNTVTPTEPEIGADQLLAEINKKNSDNVAAAEKIQNEVERESAKAKAFNQWSDDLNKFIAEQKLKATDKSDANKKLLTEKTINEASKLIQEKKSMAIRSMAKADGLKQKPIVSATPTTPNKTAENKPIPQKDAYDALINIDKKYNGELASAEKITNEVEREKVKAGIYEKWSEELNTFAAEQKEKLGEETDLNKKAFKEKAINEAIKNSHEKKSMATKSSLKAELLQQAPAVAQTVDTVKATTDNKVVAKTATTEIAKPLENKETKTEQQKPVATNNTQTEGPAKNTVAVNTQATQSFENELAAAEKINDTGEREKAKEAIYKKIAQKAADEAVVLKQEYAKENDPTKKADLAKKISVQEQLQKQNNELAKKSLVAAEFYFQNKAKTTGELEEVSFTTPPKPEKKDNPPITKTVINTPPQPPKETITTKEPAKEEVNKVENIPQQKQKALPQYEIYNRYVIAKPEIQTQLKKNEVFDIKPEPVYTESKPIPARQPKNGLVFVVQVGAFKNPIAQSTFGGINPITYETTATGYMRYMAGEFTQYSSADKVKNEIRNIGFKDAFVVAFYNGKRISLSEANNISGGSVPVEIANAQNQPKNTTTSTSNNNNTVNSANAASTTLNSNTVTKENVTGSNSNNTTGTIAAISNNVATNTVNTQNTSANTNGNSTYTEQNNTTATVTNQNTNTNQQSATAPAAKTENIANVGGLFYTVQVGVFSQPMPSSTFYNINPLFTETLEGGKVRYTVGIYNNLNRAGEAKKTAANAGINSAFVTAFYNSKRISLTEAKQYEAEGSNVFSSSPVLNILPYFGNGKEQANSITSVNNNRVQNSTANQTKAVATDNRVTQTTPVKENEPANNTSTTTESPTNNAASTDEIVYKVQVGAYKEEVPIEQATIYFKIASKGFTHYLDANGMTIYTVGNCKTYEEASKLKLELAQDYNVKDSFIVVYKNGKKVSLSEVKNK